jgi:ABC-type oligopeptide transport system substrate-binding subunit
MKAKLLAITMLVCMLSTLAFASCDVITSNQFFMNFQTGQIFAYPDAANNATILFTVLSGTFQGPATFNANSTGGSMIVTPTDNGTLTWASDNTQTDFYLNSNLAEQNSYSYQATNTSFTLSWHYEGQTVLADNTAYAIIAILLITGTVAVVFIVLFTRRNE